MKTLTTSLLVITLFIIVTYGQQAHASEGNTQPATPPDVSLHIAALQGNLEAVRQHIEAGSDLNVKDAYGSTPLTIAITFGKTDVARVLYDDNIINYRIWQ